MSEKQKKRPAALVVPSRHYHFPVKEYKEPLVAINKEKVIETLLPAKTSTLTDTLLPTKSKPSLQKEITPGNYAAVQENNQFGMIHLGKGVYSEDQLMLHTRMRQDKQFMLSVKPGDSIPIVYVGNKQKGEVYVRYVTRSKYFSPGIPINTVLVGVDGWSLSSM